MRLLRCAFPMTNKPNPAYLSSGTPPKKMLLALFLSRTFWIQTSTVWRHSFGDVAGVDIGLQYRSATTLCLSYAAERCCDPILTSSLQTIVLKLVIKHRMCIVVTIVINRIQRMWFLVKEEVNDANVYGVFGGSYGVKGKCSFFQKRRDHDDIDHIYWSSKIQTCQLLLWCKRLS